MVGTALPLASALSPGSTSLQKSRFPSDFSSSLSGGSKSIHLRRKDLMAKHYRVNAFVRINNAITSSLLHLCVNVWSFSLLTVSGPKSGKPIQHPIAIFVQD